jgi:hypothetical protein
MELVDFNPPVEPDGSHPDHMLRELRDIARLCADRPMLAYQLRTSITGRGGKWVEGMNAVSRALIDDGGTAAALFALALVARNGKGGKQAWTDEWRETLRELRRHPDADVRDEARRTRVMGTGWASW